MCIPPLIPKPEAPTVVAPATTAATDAPKVPAPDPVVPAAPAAPPARAPEEAAVGSKRQKEERSLFGRLGIPSFRIDRSAGGGTRGGSGLKL